MMNNAIDDIKERYPLLWRKLDILCKGIKDPNKDSNDSLLRKRYLLQNPHLTKRTGNNGLQIKLPFGSNELIPLNVAVFNEFCGKSPYVIMEDPNGSNDSFILYNEEDGSETHILCPGTAPDWYLLPTNDCPDDELHGSENEKNVIGDLIVLEGDYTAITSITDGCVYFSRDEDCRFCAIGREVSSDNKRSIRLKKALSAVVNDPNIRNFHLTGGNDYTPDRGIRRYIPFVKLIKQYRGDIPVAVEFTPPVPAEVEKVFMELKNAGTDSITMNMEFWNDENRKDYMPFKGWIPKDDYFKAFEAGLTIFGNNKVTCGFIVGLEDLSDTLEGIRCVTEKGVIAEVYPYKPNDGSKMAKANPNQITDTGMIMQASLYADEMMRANEIRPDLCSGCVRCGACGITQELFLIK